MLITKYPSLVASLAVLFIGSTTAAPMETNSSLSTRDNSPYSSSPISWVELCKDPSYLNCFTSYSNGDCIDLFSGSSNANDKEYNDAISSLRPAKNTICVMYLDPKCKLKGGSFLLSSGVENLFTSAAFPGFNDAISSFICYQPTYYQA